ncbi:hypothetical protein LAT59_02065 [Candidatus Gracilibacteria bacterium]|nr:hypothetical protein [Candidatus Gracilibacteria bacterium]
MEKMEISTEILGDGIDGKLAHLEEVSNQTLENFEGLFQCSHFFDSRTEKGGDFCMKSDEIVELVSIFDDALLNNRA